MVHIWWIMIVCFPRKQISEYLKLWIYSSIAVFESFIITVDFHTFCGKSYLWIQEMRCLLVTFFKFIDLYFDLTWQWKEYQHSTAILDILHWGIFNGYTISMIRSTTFFRTFIIKLILSQCRWLLFLTICVLHMRHVT